MSSKNSFPEYYQENDQFMFEVLFWGRGVHFVAVLCLLQMGGLSSFGQAGLVNSVNQTENR